MDQISSRFLLEHPKLEQLNWRVFNGRSSSEHAKFPAAIPQSGHSALKVYADHQFWNDSKFIHYIHLKRYILFHFEYLRTFCRVLIRPIRKKWSNRINFKKYTAWNIWADILGILTQNTWEFLRSFCRSFPSCFSYIQMIHVTRDFQKDGLFRIFNHFLLHSH